MPNINKYTSKDFDKHAIEYMKCRQNPLYFIQNYVHIPEIGGTLKLDSERFHPKMKRVVRSLITHNRCIFMASRQLGKALHYETRIPLTNGKFKQMKHLCYGDEIYDRHFKPTKIIGLSDVMYNRQCFELTFENNRTIIADTSHLWMVNENDEILTSQQIYDTIGRVEYFVKRPSNIGIYGCGTESPCLSDNRCFINVKIIDIKKTRSLPVRCITVDNSEGMFLCTEDYIPTHNSTTAACILDWAANFYPGIPSLILNMRQVAALNNLNTIKMIHSNLPEWLRTPFKGRAEKKTYLELENEAVIRSFYPATTAGPDQIGRSLTAPILYIDEVAFIKHIAQAYRAAQPVLSKARDQAKKNNYPTFLLMTSTPNGIAGDGKFFADMWGNAIDSDDMFDEKNLLTDESKELINAPTTNGFVRVKYHWSEDDTKDENWYLNQKKELNFDARSINQELDLLFIGSTSCIFDDIFLSKLSPKKAIAKLDLPNFSHFKLYDQVLNDRFYIIGVDTAKSLTGDYCAIEAHEYESFNQVGEFFNKLGSLTKFAEIVKYVIKYYVEKSGGKVIVGIENNSIGASIIESLENDLQYNYMDYVYCDSEKDAFKFGINTNVSTKNKMVSALYEYLNDNPERIKSSDLIDQLSVIEKRSNGSVGAKTGYHDDLFMASCFCAYIKNKTKFDMRYQFLGTNIDPKQNDLESIVSKSIKDDTFLQYREQLNEIGIFSSERELLKNLDSSIYDEVII